MKQLAGIVLVKILRTMDAPRINRDKSNILCYAMVVFQFSILSCCHEAWCAFLEGGLKWSVVSWFCVSVSWLVAMPRLGHSVSSAMALPSQ